MSRIFQREVERLKKLVLRLGAHVEQSVRQAVRAVEERNEELAQQVIDSDVEIDELEIEVEEEALKILALHQPVAIDLRFIVAVLKINNDLERIGDLSASVAERAAYLARTDRVEPPFDLHRMAVKSQEMLKLSLDALVNFDADLGRKVCYSDDEVDDIHRNMYRQVAEEIERRPQAVHSLMCLLSVSRGLERIADHATNIAQDLIYMLEGEIVRHRLLDEDLEPEMGPEDAAPEAS
jgi:phosphate transport system protein